MSSAIKREDLIKALSELTVLEAAELSKALEDKWGVSAAAAAVVAAGPAAAAGSGEAAEEQTDFTVILVKGGDKKIELIKAIRELTGLGLKEAKDMAEGENMPVKENVSKKDAADMKKKLEDAGAQITVK